VGVNKSASSEGSDDEGQEGGNNKTPPHCFDSRVSLPTRTLTQYYRLAHYHIWHEVLFGLYLFLKTRLGETKKWDLVTDNASFILVVQDIFPHRCLAQLGRGYHILIKPLLSYTFAPIKRSGKEALWLVTKIRQKVVASVFWGG
jgi:hypothetical protein